MVIRKILIAMVAAIISTSTAQADQWSGFYGGIQTGWASLDNDYSHPDDKRASDFEIDADGALIGAVAGFNWRRGNLILGIEGDISFANIDGESDTKAGHIAETNWLGTVRARAGILATNNLLLFATAGLAVMDSDFEHSGHHAWSDTFVGWAAGAGLELSTKDGIRFGLDALYVDFNDESDVHPHAGSKGGLHTLVNDPSGVVARAKIIVPLNK